VLRRRDNISFLSSSDINCALYRRLCVTVRSINWPSGCTIRIVPKLRVVRSGFDFRQGLGFFLFATASKPALGSTHPSIQWVPKALTPEVMQLVRLVPRLGMRGAIPPLPIRLHGMVLSAMGASS